MNDDSYTNYFKCMKCGDVFAYGSSTAVSQELAVALLLAGRVTVGRVAECFICYYKKERARKIHGEVHP